ncbi:MAG: hypothetical protein IKQ49_11690, partial [Eubacterium sp.]|nr:hypothetical protein [Eubacterium sp.]
TQQSGKEGETPLHAARFGAIPAERAAPVTRPETFRAGSEEHKDEINKKKKEKKSSGGNCPSGG